MKLAAKPLFLGILAAATVLAALSAWNTQPASAFFCGCSETSCTNFLGQPATVFESDPVTGTSTADCHWAHMNANAQLNQIASCSFGFCVHEFINVDPSGGGEPCKFSGGTWTIKKKVKWSCKFCLGPFTPCL